MGRYIADPEHIHALVARAQSISNRIREHIADVEREVTELGVEWEGDGSDAHRARHELLQREMTDMHDALVALGSLAIQAHDRYLANVDHNKRMWP